MSNYTETEIQLILNKITTAQASTITMNDGELYLAPDNAVYSVNNVAPVNGNVTLSIPSEVTETTVSNWGFTKNTGTVTSVNNTSPDANGNVTISVSSSVAWGNVTGTLSDQTDLKNALDAKVEYAMVIEDYTT